MTGQHNIKRLEVALRVADQASARELQQQVSSFCRDDLPDLLQSAFDSVAAKRWLCIDRLELRLPAFTSVDEFRRLLEERVRQVLQTQLGDVVASAAVADGKAVTPLPGETASPLVFDADYQAADIFIHVLEYGTAPWHAVGVDFDKVVRAVIGILKTDLSFRSQLTALLAAQPKVLNRFVMQIKPTDRCRMVALITRLEETFIGEIERVLNTVAQTLNPGGTSLPDDAQHPAKIAVRNLVRHQTFNQEARVAMLEALIGSVLDWSGDPVRSTIKDLALAGMQLEAVLPRRWLPALREYLARFADPGSGRTAPGPEEANQVLADDAGPLSDQRDGVFPDHESFPVKDAAKTPLPVAGAPLHETETPVPGEPGKYLQPQNDQTMPGPPGNADSLPAAPPQAAVPGKPATPARSRQPAHHREKTTASGLVVPDVESEPVLPSISDNTERNHIPESSDGPPWRSPFEAEAFHINNAGLVLVAPFFGMVFKDLGYLTKGRGFMSEAVRIRAVHFSQFLVTGEQHPAECHLVLNKILCGLDVAEPVRRFLDLNDAELAAAGEVLASALEHWSILKRTSVPVFRETFLQRAGILTRVNDHWLLRIERTGVDVLIDTLPWTISMIKHPWMPQALMVEW